MNIDYTFYHKDLQVFLPVVVGLIGFIIFWFTQKSTRIQQRYIDKYGNDKGSARFIISTRYLGGFTMGVLPAVAYFIAFPETRLSDLGLGLPQDNWLTTLAWIAGLSVIVITMAFFSAKNPNKRDEYPQIRAKKWTKKMVAGNLASWFGYLLGYEFLFRGVLLFPLVESIGLWPAIAVNIGLYSGTHIPKNLAETIGAIPLSIVLCLLSVATGTIWIAFFVHLAMAWTNATVSLRYHPEMEVV